MTAEEKRKVQEYVETVIDDWVKIFKGGPDRVYFDLSRYLGERILTDFDMRYTERMRQVTWKPLEGPQL